MGRPLGGYEYSYQFRGEDGIFPLYEENHVCAFSKGFLFEIRTKFNLKTRNNNIRKKKKKKLVGSERFAVSISHDDDHKRLQRDLNFRLKDDYWMSDHEIQSLARKAFNFASRTRANSSSFAPVTEVVVELDVCTVQMVGETAQAFASRAIRPKRLVPIYVWPFVPEGTEFDVSAYKKHKSLFVEMPRVRLEHDDQTGGVCPVCSLGFAVGDQIYNFSVIPGCCDHECHSHCLFKSFRKSRFSCPSCHVQIPRDKERHKKELKRLMQEQDEDSN